MNNTLHTEHLGTEQGINLTFYAKVEYCPLSEYFNEASQQEIGEFYASLDRYESVYFRAEVVADCHGVQLGIDYIGGCFYDSYEQFVNDCDYIEDMKQNAIRKALHNVARINMTLTEAS